MKQNEFIASVADFAYFDNKTGMLACTGVANLNTTFTVSEQEKNVNAGKGSQLLFSYKYGREVKCSLEAANWKLDYIAANAGQSIAQGLTDFYHINECVVLTAGVGTIADTAIGKVSVELPSGSYVEITPNAKTIDLTAQGLTTESVKVTYKYSTTTKSVTIDAASAPMVGKLVLDSNKYTSDKGKTGSVQIEVPSYQLDGNFELNFTPDGVVSTKLDGRSLAVQGDTCANGSAVYAYIREKDDTATVDISDIAATPANIALAVAGTKAITVYGIKGGLYNPILIDNAECTFTSATPATATVNTSGVVTAVASGTSYVTVTYGAFTDIVKVNVA